MKQPPNILLKPSSKFNFAEFEHNCDTEHSGNFCHSADLIPTIRFVKTSHSNARYIYRLQAFTR